MFNPCFYMLESVIWISEILNFIDEMKLHGNKTLKKKN